MSFGVDNPDFMEWRVNVKSRGRALLMLFLLSDGGAQLYSSSGLNCPP